MHLDVIAILVLDVGIIVVLARLLGALARRVGQPPVIGEILGGVLLGPTLFGGSITNALFPADVRPFLATLATLGIAVLMFLVGLHMDRDLLDGQIRIAAGPSLGAIVLPFCLGAGLALFLADQHSAASGNELGFVLFLGTAMSITAFPVLVRILTERDLLHTPIGALALACAAVDDLVAWSLLAVVVALVEGGGDPWKVLLVVPYVVLMMWVGRPLLKWLVVRQPARGRLGGVAAFVAVLAGLLVSAKATEIMDLHAIFGAFLFGVIMPREGASALRHRVIPSIERWASILFVPIFFMVAGFEVDLSTVDGSALGELGLIILVAIGGKVAGTILGARLQRVQFRHSITLAVLLNTRGLTELVVLTVGLQLGVLDRDLYSLMVVMALVTTAMTGVLLRFVYPARQVRRETTSRHERVADGDGDLAESKNDRSLPDRRPSRSSSNDAGQRSL